MSEPSQTPPAPPAAPQAGPAGGTYKKPLLAAFLSAMPGLGNIYNGLYLRGVLFFVIIISLIALSADHGLLGFALAFFWLFNVVDAYRQATLINYGYAQDLGITDRPKPPLAGQGGYLAGTMLFAIGLFATMEKYFEIDLDRFFDLWPFGLMALGAWVLWRTVQERKGDDASKDDDDL